MTADEASPATHWQIIAELPYVDLEPAYQEVRKMRHVLYKPFDAAVDEQVSFAYRGYEFRIVRCDDHLDILVNDPDCPTDVLLEPLTQLITPLSRCSLKRE
jgi:hypothetical protein